VGADVACFGDAEVGVETKGVLPMLAGPAVLAGCVVSVAESGVGAGLLVAVSSLDGQGERGGMLKGAFSATPTNARCAESIWRSPCRAEIRSRAEIRVTAGVGVPMASST